MSSGKLKVRKCRLSCNGAETHDPPSDPTRYYSYVTGPLIGAKYTPTDSTATSNCQETGIRYLPKGS